MKKAAKPLINDTFPTTNKHSPVCFEIPYHTTPYKWVDGDIYFCEENVNQIRNAIKNNIDKDPNYPDRIAKNLYKMKDKVLATTASLVNQDLKHLSNKNLLETFAKSFEQIGLMECFMSYRGTVQLAEALEEKVKQALAKKLNSLNMLEHLDNYFLILARPLKESIMIQYKNELPKAKLLLNKSNKSSIIKNLHVKYSWMGCCMFDGKHFTKKHFEEELQSIKQPQKLLKKYKKKRQDEKNKYDNLLQELSFTKDELQKIHQLQHWIFLRTYAKDNVSKAVADTMFILKEIAKRAEIPWLDIHYLIKKEIKTIFSLHPKELRSIIEKRKKRWGALVEDYKVTFFAEDLSAIEEKESLDQTDNLQGQIAAKGHVKGPVVLMNNASEIEKVKHGSILVTPMTTTDYTPILSKLKGLITDEGGITCHAAIVSRELNIPCIIGTRHATKLLKDGDNIILDANKGLVTILNN